MTTSQSQRRVVITGAASGLGKSIALDMARQGHSLFLTDIKSEGLDETNSQCLKLNTQSHCLAADLCQDDLSNFASKAEETLGGVDVLINSAGIFIPTPVQSGPTLGNKKIIDINLTATIELCSAFAPVLSRQDLSYMIILSSMAAKTHMPPLSTYCASKAGISAFANAAFAELRQLGVKVTSIMPAFLDTPMTQNVNLAKEHLMNPSVIVDTINFILNLHSSACPREIVIDNQISPYRA